MNTLKDCLTIAPIFVPFVTEDYHCPTTDASYAAIGSVLERLSPIGKLLGVIGYFSKSISDTQSCYHIGKLGLLAIGESLKHFRYDLRGHEFLLCTDYNFVFLYQTKKELSERLAGWLQYLGEFTFDIEHVKTRNNIVMEALSRPQEICMVPY